MAHDGDFRDEWATLITNRSSLAALVLLIYDIALTFTDEVFYIWRTPCSLLKYVYIMARYYTLVALISLMYFGRRIGERLGIPLERFCPGWLAFIIISLHIIVTSMEIILIMRVYALYNRSRRLLAIILIAFAIEQAAMIVSIVLTIPAERVNPRCLPTYTPDSSLGFIASPIAFEAFLLGLCAYAWLRGVRSGWGRVSTFRQFMRDGIWAFFTIFAFFTASGVTLVVVKGPANGILFPWQYTISSICASRLTLHMRERSTAHDRSSARLPPNTSSLVLRTGHARGPTQSAALTTFVHDVDDGQYTEAYNEEWEPPESPPLSLVRPP